MHYYENACGFPGACCSVLSPGTLSYSTCSLQLMVPGLTGRTGATVLLPVAAECRIDQELVPILRRRLEESHALERVTKRECVMKIHAQVTLALIID